MPQALQITFGIVALVVVFILTQFVAGRRIRSACRAVVEDLERLGATDPLSAVELPYAKVPLIRFGLRDFRPKALHGLVAADIVGSTARGGYYIKNRDQAQRLRLPVS
jgi:hypothetical protein